MKFSIAKINDGYLEIYTRFLFLSGNVRPMPDFFLISLARFYFWQISDFNDF